MLWIQLNIHRNFDAVNFDTVNFDAVNFNAVNSFAVNFDAVKPIEYPLKFWCCQVVKGQYGIRIHFERFPNQYNKIFHKLNHK